MKKVPSQTLYLLVSTQFVNAVWKLARQQQFSDLGAIGFICVQWLRALGCTKVIAVDVADDKLALAKRLGATAGVNGMKTDAVAAIKELTGGEGVDIAIEFAGNKITHVQAVASARRTVKLYTAVLHTTT